jgi:hypothetical protein
MKPNNDLLPASDEAWSASLRVRLRRSFIIGTVGYILAAVFLGIALWSMSSKLGQVDQQLRISLAGETDIPCNYEGSLRSLDGYSSTSISFTNATAETKQIFWLDYSGERKLYSTLEPNKSFNVQTYMTHPWIVVNKSGACEQIYMPTRTPRTIIINSGL